jgi:16S rRNA (uracil1498-N3)-methyltransferase
LQLLLDPHSNTLLREAVPAGGSPLTFLVGPEGGFSPEELALACEAGIRTVRLGRTVLRAETAAITAAAQAVALLEPGSPPG